MHNSLEINESLVKAKSAVAFVALLGQCVLASTQYCYAQYCMVYGIHTGGVAGWSNLAQLYIVFVSLPCGQCRWGGGNTRMIDSCINA